jgi:hypothetical protein
MFGLNAAVMVFQDFKELFGWRALSVLYLGNVGF